MWQMLNTIAGCICIPLLTYWVLEFRKARKNLEDIIHNFYDTNHRKIEYCSEMIDALKKDMNRAATKTDLLANSVEYWGTNPASLPLKEHKQLIKDVAQIKSELEAITAIVNRGMVKRGKKNTYLTKPWGVNIKKENNNVGRKR